MFQCPVRMVLDVTRGLEEFYGTVEIEDGRIQQGGVVLIDEPDNHVHVLWQLA